VAALGALAFTALSQRRFQHTLHMPQVLQSLSNLLKPRLNQRLNLPTGHGIAGWDGEQYFHVVEGKTNGLSAADKSKSPHRFIIK